MLLTTSARQAQRAAQAHAIASQPRRPNRWDQRKLTSIYRRKHGHLPGYHYLADDDAGRAWLTALLRCGLSAHDALQHAPWLDATTLQGLQRAARRLRFDDIGPLVGLTLADIERFKAWRFLPCDLSCEKFEKYKRERRKRKNRDSKREKRAERQPRRLADLRDDAVLRMLKAGPTTLPELTRRAKDSPAFARTGYLDSWADSLRELVRRVVRRLERLGVVETDRQPGRFGPVLGVRLVPCEADVTVAAKPQHPTVAARKNAAAP
jgi:hypothetical protein